MAPSYTEPLRDLARGHGRLSEEKACGGEDCKEVSVEKEIPCRATGPDIPVQHRPPERAERKRRPPIRTNKHILGCDVITAVLVS